VSELEGAAARVFKPGGPHAVWRALQVTRPRERVAISSRRTSSLQTPMVRPTTYTRLRCTTRSEAKCRLSGALAGAPGAAAGALAAPSAPGLTLSRRALPLAPPAASPAAPPPAVWPPALAPPCAAALPAPCGGCTSVEAYGTLQPGHLGRVPSFEARTQTWWKQKVQTRYLQLHGKKLSNSSGSSGLQHSKQSAMAVRLCV
jgi:hypothetical protein